MSQLAPTSQGTVNPVESLGETMHDIDRLAISDTWKKRFKWVAKAGGPAMSNLKNMPRAERVRGMQFNILAFFLGPFYYIAKGMWKKGVVLFAVCVAVVLVLTIVLNLIGYPKIGNSLGYGVAAVFAVRANIDYYKKMVLRENGWW